MGQSIRAKVLKMMYIFLVKGEVLGGIFVISFEMAFKSWFEGLLFLFFLTKI